MSNHVLVLGAAGFAGSHLLEWLAAAEPAATITAVHRPGHPPPPDLPAGGRIAWRACDVLDRPSLTRLVHQSSADEIYHCAGAAHVGSSWRSVTSTYALNVLGSHYLLGAVRESGRRPTVLLVGSAMVYKPSNQRLSESSEIGPDSPYGLSKLAQELIARRAVDDDGASVIVTRSFNHFGPRQNPAFAAASFARQIADMEAGRLEPVLRVGNLEARRDLTDVRDTVRAYHLLVKRGRSGAVYNVCSGSAIRIADVLEGLLALARRPIAVQPDRALFRPADTPLLLGSPDLLRRETGWTPEHSLEQSLTDLLDYWRSRGGEVSSARG